MDNFDDRYLGAKASDPSLDNDGNALAIGALYFNTTDGVMKVYTASGWIAASSASVATLATFEFVATSGQTVFTGNDANGSSLSYVAPAIIVTLNGVRLRPGDDYTATNGTSITLISAAALNDELVVDAFGSFLVANTYTIAEVDAFAVKLTGNQTVAGIKTFSSDPVMGVSGLTGTLNKLRLPAGSVLQVVQGTLSSNYSTNSTSFQAIGANVSITPSSSSSRILLMASVGVGVSASNYVDLSIFRDSTNLAGSFGFITTYSSSPTLSACQNFNHVDSPATTSAISYSIRMRSQTGVGYGVVNGTGQTCTIIAMEIAG